MNILILNGNPDPSNRIFDEYIHSYQLKLHKLENYVQTYSLRTLKINVAENHDNQVIKNSGKLPEDDLKYIFNALRDTDLLVFASPLKHGTTSSLMRIVQDRINRKLQTKLLSKKVSHPADFPVQHIPMMGMILQKAHDTVQQELLLNKLAQERIAANLRTWLSFFITTEMSLAEAVCETLKSTEYQLSIENTYHDFLTGSSGRFDLI